MSSNRNNKEYEKRREKKDASTSKEPGTSIFGDTNKELKVSVKKKKQEKEGRQDQQHHRLSSSGTSKISTSKQNASSNDKIFPSSLSKSSAPISTSNMEKDKKQTKTNLSSSTTSERRVSFSSSNENKTYDKGSSPSSLSSSTSDEGEELRAIKFTKKERGKPRKTFTVNVRMPSEPTSTADNNNSLSKSAPIMPNTSSSNEGNKNNNIKLSRSDNPSIRDNSIFRGDNPVFKSDNETFRVSGDSDSNEYISEEENDDDYETVQQSSEDDVDENENYYQNYDSGYEDDSPEESIEYEKEKNKSHTTKKP